MTGKSKRMEVTEAEMGKIADEIARINDLMKAVEGFKPESGVGKDAYAQTMNEFNGKLAELRDGHKKLRDRLEVETVHFLAGKDADEGTTGPLRMAS